ncbi:MAG: hypothetical protein DME26_16140 [Verrucomicrobia bacterium]|nr:MAG: hypothetical protein DME26_16140 [Verrucomicrobiota bacterium]
MVVVVYTQVVAPAGRIPNVPWIETMRISFVAWPPVAASAFEVPAQLTRHPVTTLSKNCRSIAGNEFMALALAR